MHQQPKIAAEEGTAICCGCLLQRATRVVVPNVENPALIGVGGRARSQRKSALARRLFRGAALIASEQPFAEQVHVLARKLHGLLRNTSETADSKLAIQRARVQGDWTSA